MAQPILQVEHIHKDFGETEALHDLSLYVCPGEFLTLLGPSGCGKTTLLRIIAGLESADSGRILLNGQDVTAFPPNRRELNMVFQNYALFPHMTVFDNIAYGLKINKVSKEEIRRKVTELLMLISLPGYETRMPDQLSGGERQRVAIARALAKSPSVLLLDEPLGALDLQLRRSMQVELKRLQKNLGITFIYITHDQEEALNMSDRIGVMNQGRLIQIAPPDEIYERPATAFVARFIGSSNLLSGTAEQSADGTTVLASPAGRFLCAGKFAPGTALTLSVRFERLRLSSGPENGFSLPARVAQFHFAGSTVTTTLALKDGQELKKIDMAGAPLPEQGNTVYLSWDPQTAVVVEGGDGA